MKTWYAAFSSTRTVVLTVVLSVLLGACGGGGGGGDSGNGNAPPPPVAVNAAPPMTSFSPVSDSEFENAVVAFGAILKQQHDMGAAAGWTRKQIAQSSLVAVQAVATTIPGFYDAGLAPGGNTVWVRLKDGTPLGSIDNQATWMWPRPSANASPAVRTLTAAASTASQHLASVGRALGDTIIAPAQANSAPLALPTNNRAFIFDTDNLSPVAAGELATMLQARGYQVTSVTAPSLSVMRSSFVNSAAGYSIVWINSHAGTWARSDGTTGFGITTGEPVIAGKCASAPDVCASVRADIKANRAAALSDPATGNGYVVITPEFLRAYWRFPPDSLVVLNVCSSAFFFGDVDAGLVIGWSHPVTVDFVGTTTQWMFDRMLGANRYQPNTPKQRPFPALEVLKAMQSRGLTFEPPQGNGQPDDTGTELRWQQKSANELILVPSLRNMQVDESEKKLTLYGEFGKTPGTVEINGASAGVRQWSDRRIELPLSDSDKGPVVVKSGGIKGNAVPITDWEISNFRARHYLIGALNMAAPGPYMEANCTLHFRADIHPYRLRPEEAPKSGDMDDNGPRQDGHVEVHNIASNSRCLGDSGGSGVTRDGATRISFGSALAGLIWRPDDGVVYPAPWYYGRVSLYPEQRKFTLCVNSRGRAVPMTVTDLASGASFTADFGDTSSGAVCAAALDSKTWPLSATFGMSANSERFPLGNFGAPGDEAEVNFQGLADPATVPSVDTEG